MLENEGRGTKEGEKGNWKWQKEKKTEDIKLEKEEIIKGKWAKWEEMKFCRKLNSMNDNKKRMLLKRKQKKKKRSETRKYRN